MRMIGHLDGETKARTFSDYLYVQGIENQIEAEKDGTWALWIHAEEELERAGALLAGFRENPADPKYTSTAQAAGDLKEQKRKEQADYEKRLKQRRHLFQPLRGYGFGPVTFVLIFISVVVFILSGFANHLEAVQRLFISDMDVKDAWLLPLSEALAKRISNISVVLPEIRHGEVWRLFTPMFIHMDVLHILFNMLWLRDLGSMIEGRQKSWLLLIMVFAVAAVSNLTQYFLYGPTFGGMSGVVYGLFGYIWIRGKLDPGSGLQLHQSTVTMMIIWFFLCLFGVIGHVANGAHAAGLLMGMAWGWLSSLKYR